VALTPCAACRAGDSFAELLQRIPDQANAVLLVDVDAIHQSPFGQREHLARQHEQDYLAGVCHFPPSVSRFVVAAQLDPTTLQPLWKISLAALRETMPLRALMRHEGGSTDRVAGQQVVVSPRDGYYLYLERQVLAEMAPANRQALSRWLRFTDTNSRVVLSPYLQKAAARLGSGTQVVLALDLADVFDTAGIRKLLARTKCLEGKRVDLDALAAQFAGLHGLTITMHVHEAITGELRLDFSGPVEPFRDHVKPVVLEAMESMGAYIPDLVAWQVRAEGNTVTLRGSQSERGVRRIVSLLLSPAAVTNSQPAELVNQPQPESKGAASQRYFRSISTLLDDLKQEKTTNWNKLAYFYEQYSRKIDQLPMLNADPDLLKFGASISTTLRAIGSNATQAGLQQKVLAANAQGGYVETPGNFYSRYRYDYWGRAWGYSYYEPNVAYVSNFGQISNLMAVGQANEKALRDQTWNNIDAATTAIRRKMVEKYQLEF
jgi:hypothetical protein